MQKQEMNCETGEIIIREMTDEEIAEFRKEAKLAEARAKEYENKRLARAALLEKLGLTEDEAQLLLNNA